MTRINLGIHPEELCDQHLLAEYRELPRIVSAVMKRIDNGKGFDDIPEQFTLGKGHVKYFYNKGSYLVARQDAIIKELLRRGFNIQFTDELQWPWEMIENKYLKYPVTVFEQQDAQVILRERICERLSKMSNARWTKSNRPQWCQVPN